jgi:serpin B
MQIYIRIFFIFIILAGCANSPENPESPNPEIRDLTVEEQHITSSTNIFVFKMLDILSQAEDNNLFFSPLSVQYALAMSLNGADRNTYDEIKTTLSVEGLNEQEINESFKTLTEYLRSVDTNVTLEIANSIWYEKKLEVKENFNNSVSQYFDARVSGLDFSAPQSVNTINGWVKDKTNGMIEDLIDQIPQDAVMYLINAIYYKSEWKYKFDIDKTKPGPFYLESDENVLTDLMEAKEMGVNYFSNSDIELIELPYGNGQYIMSVLVPGNGKKVADIVDLLDEKIYQEWTEKADSISADIILPKFKIEYKALLNDALIEMGMEDAFTDKADFSRLFVKQLGLRISRVLQKAAIEVNEDGTEAAAATSVEISLTSLPPETPVIKINRPFLFFIKEKNSGVILFGGKLMDPR